MHQARRNPSRVTLLAALALAALALVAAACTASTPTPTPTATPQPTPTPPYGLPPLSLPADEAPHDFQTEWWYFNVHLRAGTGHQFSLHDVVFQVQELASGRTLYVRQVGFANAADSSHVSGERLLTAQAPLASDEASFEIDFGDSLIAGEGGTSYRLTGGAGGSTYDLTLQSEAAPLVHDDDGLVDFREAGVTYYYSRPRLAATGTVTLPGGTTHDVTGLGWFDKQWGNFQPVAVGWDWASVQLDDGTDLMLSRLFDDSQQAIDVYATLREPGGEAQRLGADDFTFTPLEGGWPSERTGTTYATRWHVTVPGSAIAFDLEPLIVKSEFVSAVLGVTYWEAGVVAVDRQGQRIGQGFVELNWPRGTAIANAAR
jgi:predicted secreted hydrolase